MSYSIIRAMNVDTHFHIFLKKDCIGEGARYPIGYDSLFDDWVEVSKNCDISKGVLIQPSFLGFNNELLLQTIAKFPERLKGVAAVPASTTQKDLSELKSKGIIGIRLNLFGSDNPVEEVKENLQLIQRLTDLGMHVQIHHNDGLLNQILLGIPKGTTIVIDHFGRPFSNSEFHLNSEGIDRHLNNLWVKLSAQYRTPRVDHKIICDYWLNKIGDSKLLWGSDWPHTKFEKTEFYEKQLSQFFELVEDEVMQTKILSLNPQNLYWKSV